MRQFLVLAIAICFLPATSFALSCNQDPIPVEEAKARAAALELSPFNPMYLSAYFGYIGATGSMLTSDSQLTKAKRDQLWNQQTAVMVLSALYLVFSSGSSPCPDAKSDEPFAVEDLTIADLNPDDARKAQQRFLIFHSVNMVSLGLISFESKSPDKGVALTAAFFVPLVVDTINRKFFSTRAYSPWTLTGGISETGDPTLAAWYEF